MKQVLFTKARNILLTISMITMVATACKKDMLGINNSTELSSFNETIVGIPNGKVFDVARFKQNLQYALATPPTQPRGYTFIINKGGQIADSASLGIAFFAGNSSGKQHTNQEINIASVTKTMTGVAVMQLMKKRSKNMDSTIGAWLPAKWNASSSIKTLTFGELLSHSSGITQSNTTWAQVKTTIKGPLDNPAKPADVYANMNFALFRVIIPYMQNKTACVAQENAQALSNPTVFEAWLSDQYLDYMQDNVFTPIGLGSITCKPSVNSAWGFNEPPPNSVSSASMIPTDWTPTCGGGGLYMSVMEMARFMAYISHTNILLDQTQRSLMDSKYFGWDNEDSPMTVAGKAYGKDGALWVDSNNSGVQDAGDAGLQTFVIKFPNKIELSLAINSIPGKYRGIAGIVTNAYNNAWIAE